MDPIPGYELEALIGAGAMGTVHRARQRAMDGRLVAIKRVRGADAEQRERLRREAAVLAELDHPHIIRIIELLPDGDSLAIVMQHAPGGSLADRLEQRGPVAPAALVGIAAPVAGALASAHRRGVLHRDVKPANILFTSDGLPLLSDFGIARWSRAQPLTAPDALGLGTAEYLDPAVADGAAPDERSDVYALGVTCYEALAGRRPFEGATPLAVLRAADRGEAPPLTSIASGIPTALAAVVHTAMARDPEGRYPDADAMAEALHDALPGRPRSDPLGIASAGAGTAGASTAGAPAATPTPPSASDEPRPAPASRPETRTFGPRPPAPPEPEPQRVPWPAIIAVALVLLLVPVGVVLALRDGDPSPAPTAPPTVAAPTPSPTATPTPTPTPTEVACPDLDEPDAPPGTEVLVGDLDGDGCPSVVRRTGTLVEAEVVRDEPPRRYEVGALGDALLLGDWNCDGVETAGLYRPSTGEVFLFFGWAEVGEPLEARPSETLAPGGRARVTQGGPGGCDVIEVLDSPSVEA